MCEVLGVSKSGYYYWKKELKDCLPTLDLDVQIKDAFKESGATYGSPRIFKALRKAGVTVSESKVARRMKILAITHKVTKKFKSTTDSNHDKLISPNILNRVLRQSVRINWSF